MQSFEIFSKKWELDGQNEGTHVSLTFTDAWDIRIDQCDTGASVERTYGDWDYEQWLVVPRAQAATLMRVLFQYAFNQHEPLGFQHLATLLEREGVTVERGSWV
ncbi:hypothetical protein [Sedimentimonas flavescens]|uniref:hypothetical protein n=1 Tax=Sedimentimonas flavescens TaxID=2851012 RepID=UPI0021A4F15D|nr:hypothetical protein [Sedimentimonas flavescens]MCT2538746.1 hypothetical protein [Sedimentimonas flavescens]